MNAQNPLFLANGFRIESDTDGDWVLIPPSHITIVSVPGEGFLLEAVTREEAETEAREYLAAWKL